MAMASYLIIGAGNFGAATALTLAKRGAKVTLIDTAAYPNPRAASHDVNKIVRDDYPDRLYMRMLIKAMPKWRNDELYSTFYHEVGMLRADASNFGDESMAAYKAMGIPNDSEYLPVDEARRRWNGAFATANFDGLDKILYNPTVGYAEADKALGAVVQAAVDQGVEYVVGVMKKLNFGAGGQCTGITLETGEVLQADKMLLATGARTAALLAQSAPENKQLHVGDRVVATGAISFYAKLFGEQKERFEPIPVLKNCLPQVKGEGMWMLKDGTIKFNCDMCFTNYATCPATGERMSVAPDENVFNVWTGPKFINFFQQRARKTINGLYGKEVEDIPIDAYRMCWDASTPTHDFLITPHPHCQGLYVATGGSFHGWKFLPVIGDYVADMMQDSLDADYVDRWAWDKKGGDGHSANPTYQVVGDLQDWIS
ncbi:L-saccharopine oxidase [Tolypocladium ophioglossoides CBS 100239]|uniref:L-saccharopine oxidase n=1 Tax=Tolypocladium ophioglossoides (strain CBS 100239) TaxID=1163406 RepID=A0A0L0N903_TOLOC|nr:L-saccharopine oxidase [Tolypocladium ophioglossoides CBS 100239]